jgi:hypothetical protein
MTEKGNKFFAKASKEAQKTFYLDGDDDVKEEEVPYPTPDSQVDVGDGNDMEVDVDLERTVGGVREIAEDELGIDNGLLADARGEEEVEKVVLWDGFWEVEEVESVSTVL